MLEAPPRRLSRILTTSAVKAMIAIVIMRKTTQNVELTKGSSSRSRFSIVIMGEAEAGSWLGSFSPGGLWRKTRDAMYLRFDTRLLNAMRVRRVS